jgi:hypothetical protein
VALFRSGVFVTGHSMFVDGGHRVLTREARLS